MMSFLLGTKVAVAKVAVDLVGKYQLALRKAISSASCIQ